MEDDRGKTEFQREAAGTGDMTGVWKEVAKGSLVTHYKTQHEVEKWRLVQEGDKEAGGENPRT